MDKDLRNEGKWEDIDRNRDGMKCPEFGPGMAHSDQQKELPQPPLSKQAQGDIVLLSDDYGDELTNERYADLLEIRRSERVFDKSTPVTKKQLAFLLWSIQGIQEIRGESYATLRPVPSGGARHPFETYFFANNVEGLDKGIYHYLPHEHIGEKQVSIEFVQELPDHKKLGEHQ